MQYTGGWEDFIVLFIFSIIGFFCRHFKFSRPALLIGFILSEKIEKLSIQMLALYDLDSVGAEYNAANIYDTYSMYNRCFHI